MCSKLDEFVRSTLHKLETLPECELIQHSPYALEKMKEINLCLAEFGSRFPDSKNVHHALQTSLEYGLGTAIAVNFSWHELSEVALHDTELESILVEKIVFSANQEEKKQNIDPVEIRLNTLDLFTAVAEYELVGLGPSSVPIKVNGIDCALVASTNEAARKKVLSAINSFLLKVLPSARIDQKAYHSALDVLGNFV